MSDLTFPGAKRLTPAPVRSIEPKIIRSYEPSSSDNATSKRHGGIRDASMSLHSFNSDIRDHQSDEPKFRSIYAARFFPELAQLVELDLEKPWPTVDSVCVSAWAPVALADAVASPLAFTAREPEMALAMASRPHKFFASAWLLEAAVTNALPCPCDSAKLAALARALPSAEQHLSPARATALEAARLSAEVTPEANASESTSAVVSALGVRQMQSR